MCLLGCWRVCSLAFSFLLSPIRLLLLLIQQSRIKVLIFCLNTFLKQHYLSCCTTVEALDRCCRFHGYGWVHAAHNFLQVFTSLHRKFEGWRLVNVYKISPFVDRTQRVFMILNEDSNHWFNVLQDSSHPAILVLFEKFLIHTAAWVCVGHVAPLLWRVTRAHGMHTCVHQTILFEKVNKLVAIKKLGIFNQSGDNSKSIKKYWNKLK